MQLQKPVENEVAFWNIINDIFKRNSHNEKKLRAALHLHFYSLLEGLVNDLNSKNDIIDNLEERLIDSNIEQQGLLASNAAMVDKLKRNDLYANEHKITETRINELRNQHKAGVNIRGGDLPIGLE